MCCKLGVKWRLSSVQNKSKEGDPKVKRVALFAFLSFILSQWVICKKKIAILLNFKRIAIVCLESFYYL